MKTIAILPTSCLILLTTAAWAASQTASPSSSVPPVVGTTRTPTAAPTTTAPAAGARSAAPAVDYRLVTGDKLRIEVYKDAQLSQSAQIRPDGKITLPLVGDVAAAGRTSTDLRDAIAAALKEYITNPLVTVIVVETVPETIYVMGEVNAAGTIPMKGQMSVVQALAMAGGFKDFANTKDIKILRRTSTGTTTLSFNYKDAVKSDTRMLYLQPGDTIIVK